MAMKAQDYSFFHSTEPDTHQFIIEALDHFFDLHTGVPSVCIIEFWRRLTLPASEWTALQYKNVTVRIVSPQDHGCPSLVENLGLPPDVAICLRDTYSPAPMVSAIDLLKGNINVNSVNPAS